MLESSILLSPAPYHIISYVLSITTDFSREVLTQRSKLRDIAGHDLLPCKPQSLSHWRTKLRRAFVSISCLLSHRNGKHNCVWPNTTWQGAGLNTQAQIRQRLEPQANLATVFRQWICSVQGPYAASVFGRADEDIPNLLLNAISHSGHPHPDLSWHLQDLGESHWCCRCPGSIQSLVGAGTLGHDAWNRTRQSPCATAGYSKSHGRAT